MEENSLQIAFQEALQKCSLDSVQAKPAPTQGESIIAAMAFVSSVVIRNPDFCFTINSKISLAIRFRVESNVYVEIYTLEDMCDIINLGSAILECTACQPLTLEEVKAMSKLSVSSTHYLTHENIRLESGWT